MTSSHREEVAVVGIGCRFPGGVYDLETFWNFLIERGDAIVPVPPERWNSDRFYDADAAAPGKSSVRNGGFLKEEVRAFDPLFFGISPREAAYMDPQQRLLLEVAWEAMEEGGLVPAELAGSNTGVYVGGFALDHMAIQFSPLSRDLIDSHHTATAASMTMLAARLSYVFDFRGPSMALDTACSSSLVALHYACQGLLNGDCGMALAGGVNVMLSPQYPMVMSKGHFLSPDGHCKSFDSRADGYARGEGAGVVVLKRLSDAVRDGDRIHAVIRATGVNQDGHTNGITVPSADAQEALVREVAARGGVPLGDIAYVEAHGTGTPVGDPLEAAALARTIGAARREGDPVMIGSVKANIGHLEAAAGVAGLIKACLCVERGAVPPQANLAEPNPDIPFADWNLKLPRNVEALPRGEKPLFVGVNSFGYGGTNAHAILRDHRAVAQVPDECAVRKPLYLPVSARGEAALKAMASAYAQRIAADPDIDLAALSYSAGRHRSDFEHHAVVIGENPADFIAALNAFSAGEDSDAIVTGRRSGNGKTPVAFVFSGMGPQWWAMGQTLIATDPVFRAAARDCDAIFKRLSGWSIVEEMNRPEADSRMHETQVAQPANFVIQVGLAAMLKHRGIEPAAIAGHSVGEVSAAYVSGALDLEDAVLVSYHRSRLQQTTAGTGTMLAVGLSLEECETMLKGREALVSIGAINSPRAITLAGNEAALKQIAAELEEKAVFHRFLKVEVPYHSPLMEPLKEDIAQALAGLKPQLPAVPLYSTVTGVRWNDEERHDADYWFRNVRAPVRFRQAIEAMVADGHCLFLEVGPNPVLSGSIRECAAAVQATVDVVYTLRRNEPEVDAANRMIANLIAAGACADWARLAGSRRFVPLPTYRFQRDIYWLETPAAAADRLGGNLHPILGASVAGATPAFSADMSVNYMPWMVDHRIEDDVVFPGAGYVEAALAAHAAIEDSEPAIVEALELQQAMLVNPARRFELQWIFDRKTRELKAMSRDGDGADWNTHACMRVLAGQPWVAARVDPGGLDARLAETVDATELYTELSQRGLNYGPSFRTIRALKRGGTEVLADLALSDADLAKAGDYRIHPALLDGAFQALIAACGTDGDGKPGLFMPVSIRRILYHGRAGGAVRAHGRLVERSAEAIEGDIVLMDTQGTVLLEVRGLRCIAVGGARAARIPLERWLYAYRWEAAETPAHFASDARFLVLADGGAMSTPLSAWLDRQGAREIILVSPGDAFARLDEHHYTARPGSVEDMRALMEAVNIADIGAVIDLRSAEGSRSDHEADPTGTGRVSDLLALVQALPAEEPAPRLYAVTRALWAVDGTETIDGLWQSAAAGFLRVVALERPELKATLIDIDAAITPAAVRRLGAEILADAPEDDVALRDGERHVHRLLRQGERLNPEEKPAALADLGIAEPAFRLDVPAVGHIDKLRFRQMPRRAPQEGEVELRILSTALNFKDILKILGVLPKKAYENTFFGETLGMEASAVVTAVGEGVTGFAVGERIVAAVPDCLASHVVLPAGRLFALKQPEGQSGAEGATIPVAFMTAYYALNELARLKKGEKVLIHAATGGVGLAAIQIAQWLGAEIFATAGNPAKRDYLRSLGVTNIWDSRNLEFSEGIRAATGGRGVDVVLNSLSGEAFQESLTLVAPFGRFVEIGKRDIMENSRIPMLPFNENMSFNSVDLDRMMVERPQVIQAMLGAISGLLSQGVLRPLPVTRFRAADVVDSLRHMAQAKHMGKIVVDFEDLADVTAVPLAVDKAAIKPDATYLVTGAFGGVGLELVRMLVARGARHLVMASRSGASNEAARAALADFASAGVTVREAKLDMADKSAVEALIGNIGAIMPPLKGIFHAAAVLDDALIDNLDAGRLARVMEPKARGAWNLHRATLDLPLDIFMLFSSATSIIGNPGQASYVAANVFLDALAEHRKAMGLAATAVNWGAIGGAGMLAGDDHAARQLERAGVRRIPVEHAIAALPRVLELDPGVMAVMDVDFSAWTSVFPGAKDIPRFAALTAGDSASDASAGIRDALAAMEPAERSRAVTAGILDIVAQALHVPVEKIACDRPLSELGIDSLVGVELQSALGDRFGVQISILQLSKGGSVSDMAAMILKRLNLASDGPQSERIAA